MNNIQLRKKYFQQLVSYAGFEDFSDPKNILKYIQNMKTMDQSIALTSFLARNPGLNSKFLQVFLSLPVQERIRFNELQQKTLNMLQETIDSPDQEEYFNDQDASRHARFGPVYDKIDQQFQQALSDYLQKNFNETIKVDGIHGPQTQDAIEKVKQHLNMPNITNKQLFQKLKELQPQPQTQK